MNEAPAAAVPAATNKTALARHAVARAMFKRVAGTDGFIDSVELRQLCDEMEHPLTEQQLAIAMAKLDTDGDGRVSVDEFLWWFDMGLKMEALLDDSVGQHDQSARLIPLLFDGS